MQPILTESDIEAGRYSTDDVAKLNAFAVELQAELNARNPATQVLMRQITSLRSQLAVADKRAVGWSQQIADVVAEHIPDWQAEADYQSQLYQDPGAGETWLKTLIVTAVLPILQGE